MRVFALLAAKGIRPLNITSMDWFVRLRDLPSPDKTASQLRILRVFVSGFEVARRAAAR